MSAAAVPAVPPAAPARTDAAKYDRMVTIWRWLQGVGCCGLCAIGMAIAQVEREMGDTSFRASKTPGCRRAGKEPDCFELGRSKWAELPKGKP